MNTSTPKQRQYHRSATLALTVSLLATGCSSQLISDAGTDLLIDGSVSQDTGIGAAADADSAIPTNDAGQIPISCVTPKANLEITKDTQLCPGEYQLDDLDENGAIRIMNSGVTLTCDKTILIGAARYTASSPHEVGIVIVGGLQDVTVTGCTARSFRYGLVAKGSQKLHIQDNNFSGNFSDEKADWVFDAVSGGGIRFENVTDSTISNNQLEKNFNGIELRGANKITVENNQAAHCTNTGALVLDTHHSRFEKNDFSWGIRGALSYPTKWYGVDTKDSASLLLDAGSSYNEIVENNLTYGGDGLFLRAIIGACPHHNYVEKNDTSYSPHNAIESWCDNNTYIANKANYSHYGFWLGGSDQTIVRGNEVIGNKIDGISIQIAESRQMLIEDNQIQKNGRVGLLATGREYQAWHPLTYWATGRLANASQYVIQRNAFDQNTQHDIFLSAIRGVVLASNTYEGELNLKYGKDALGVTDITDTPAPSDAKPPSAALVAKRTALGFSIAADASGSKSASAKPLFFYWLVQPATTSFSPLQMPTPFASEFNTVPQLTTNVKTPGAYEVRLIVHDNQLAAMATQTLYLSASDQDLTEQDDKQWTATCDTWSTCQTTIVSDTQLFTTGSSALKVTTNAPHLFHLKRSLSGQASNLATAKHISFFFRTDNPNGAWQTKSPVLIVSAAGTQIKYAPTKDPTKSTFGQWGYIDIPLEGSATWSTSGTTRENFPWQAVTDIELQFDTTGAKPYTIWIDALAAH